MLTNLSADTFICNSFCLRIVEQGVT